MTTGRRRSHAEDVVSALSSQQERERFTRARLLLKQHLVHRREVPNGRDYLFSGPGELLHPALKDLRDLESRCSRFLEFDYAQIDEYFLLRIVAMAAHQHVIDTYFD
jgi:hypothetical protein